MAKCPACNTEGAYVGFVKVECKNSKCEYFVPTGEPICPTCGIAGHHCDAPKGVAYDGDYSHGHGGHRSGSCPYHQGSSDPYCPYCGGGGP